MLLWLAPITVNGTTNNHDTKIDKGITKRKEQDLKNIMRMGI